MPAEGIESRRELGVAGRRSWEFAAIPITIGLLGFLGIVMWAFTAGPAVWVAVGVVALAALAVAALVLMARPRRSTPDAPSLPAGAAGHADDGVHRVLVVADDACTPTDLGALMADAHRSVPIEALVLAPVLGSRTARWTGDERAYAEAGRNLDATVAALGELGVPARGHVGSHDPLQALDDGLREFPADEIVFAVHPEAEANWLEAGVADAARSRYPIPVRTVRVPSEGG